MSRPIADLSLVAEPAPVRPPETTELRQACVLVARLADESPAIPSRDLEEQHAARQDLLARVHAASERFGGCSIQRAPDVAMAVFGVPHAHGNDAERAIRAALILQRADVDPSSRRASPLRVGIACGLVLVSQWRDGSDGYAVTGDAVQAADALCARAGPAETLLSDAVRASLRERIAAEELAATAPDAPRVWRLLALGVEPRFERSAFVGRRAPLRQLASALESCREIGCGQVVLVRGDAGIGKSRLVEECAVLAASRGFACHRTAILDFGAAGEDALRALWLGLLGASADADAGQARATMARIVADGLVERDREIFLGDLLGLPPPVERRSEYDAMDHEARQRGKRAAVDPLAAGAAGRQPRLLLAEDIHWADPATLDWLARLAAATQDSPIILVMTSRLEGEPLDPAWRGAMHGAALLALDLGPLRPEEALELIPFPYRFSLFKADKING